MRFPSPPLTLLVLFFCMVANAHAQVTVREIKESNPISKDQIYIFPSIRVPGNTKASDSINNQLIFDVLEIDRRDVKKSIFENIWSTPDRTMPLLNYLSYDVLVNTSKLLSISITAESCRAYCEPFTLFYSFYTKTGERIRTDSLLTKKGLDLLRDSLKLKQQEILQSKIKSSQDTLAKNSFTSIDDKKYYEEMLELYNECLERKADFSLSYIKFYLTPTALFISTDRCSAHVNQALDEIGEFNFEFKLADWKEYFTPYLSNVLKK